MPFIHMLVPFALDLFFLFLRLLNSGRCLPCVLSGALDFGFGLSKSIIEPFNTGFGIGNSIIRFSKFFVKSIPLLLYVSN